MKEILGCPCQETCCNKPEIIYPHCCDNDCEDFCEENYQTYCVNCDASCYCEL